MNITSSLVHLPLRLSLRHFTNSQALWNFWEKDKKGGYETKIEKPLKELVKEGFKEIKPEIKKFNEEVKAKIMCDRVRLYMHNDYEIAWKFSDSSVTDSWVVTADSDHNQGKSKASFVLGANQKGVFKGYLNNDPPKDGVIKYTGYCNIRSPKNMISFKRPRPFDWDMYTHLLLRVRGDGRTYQTILYVERTFDLQWNDQYNYPLYTRGGPYWQITKIPFSKYYLSSKGRIQDKQEHVQADQIVAVGITLADDVPGPFSLEIDFIGVMFDENHNDVFEYEMFPVPPTFFS